MPRSKVVTVAGKEIAVTERKIKELEELANQLGDSLDGVLKANNIVGAKQAVIGLLYEKLPLIFPGLAEDDIKEAYPSEIESLVDAFIEIHFFTLKRLFPALMALVQAGTRNMM